MNDEELTRRLFLQGTGSLAGAGALRASLPALVALAQTACGARDNGEAFVVLQPAEARELETLAARIIPTTDTPGAREAGVIWFIDQAMNGFMAPRLYFLRKGLNDFQAQVAAAFAPAERLSDLDESDQDRHIASQQDTPFFGFARLLTLMGMFGMSSYGGNRDDVGWKLVGLNPGQHAFQPPFGYYDAAYRQGESDGE